MATISIWAVKTAALIRLAKVLSPGACLGRYRLIDVVGAGCMATVFRAHDQRLDRIVAIKIMKPAVALRPGAAERFLREACVLARLRHAGVYEIFDFVPACPPAPAHIVCELIEGPTLRQFLNSQRGRLLPETAALIVALLADVLAAVHDRGIVHRDIKPENILLDWARGQARVILADFGVAHVMGHAPPPSGALVGSPAYMSPEQVAGEELGPSSDQWGLGVLLYEMVTGCLPFAGRSLAAVVASVSRGQPRRPSQISAYAGAVFDRICMRCLAIAPADRHLSLGHLAQELRGFCAAAGLAPDRAGLHRLLSNPASVEAAVRRTVADGAVAAARRAARDGRLARALSELGRAFAYVPAHVQAERVRRALGPRQGRPRSWGGVPAAVIALGVLALALPAR